MGIKRIIQSRLLASAKPLVPKGRWRPGENYPQMVGLILYMEHISEVIALRRLQRVLTKKGTVCYTCIYQKDMRMQIPQELIDEETVLLNHKSVNWYGLVRPGRAELFMHEPFDLIVNMSRSFFFTTSYLAMVAHATFKIGRYLQPQNPYSLVLGTKLTDDDGAVIELLEKSLHFIKKA